MEVVGFLALAALVIKIVTFLKAIIGPTRDGNLVITQLVVWVVGIGVLALAGVASLTEHYVIPGFEVEVGSLDFASVIIAGLMLGSSGSFAYDATIGRHRSEPSFKT